MLQKRLAEIVERRTDAEMRLADADGRGRGRDGATPAATREAALRLAAFMDGRAAAAGPRSMPRSTRSPAEEAGARDALAEAFETLKKFEQVAEAKPASPSQGSRPPRDRRHGRNGPATAEGAVSEAATGRRRLLAGLGALASPGGAAGRETRGETGALPRDLPAAESRSRRSRSAARHAPERLDDPRLAGPGRRPVLPAHPRVGDEDGIRPEPTAAAASRRPDAHRRLRRASMACASSATPWSGTPRSPRLRAAGRRQARPSPRPMRDYIAAVVGRYRGRAVGWDVVNEAVAEDGEGLRDSLWSRNLGRLDHMRLRLRARRARPIPTRCCSSTTTIWRALRRSARPSCAWSRRCLKAGAPVSGLGTQTHLQPTWRRARRARRSPTGPASACRSTSPSSTFR